MSVPTSMSCPKFMFPLVATVLWLRFTMADPRMQTVKIICGAEVQQNSRAHITNFVTTMANLSNQVRTSGFGESVSSLAPYSNYGLAQCYGDLSTLDCVLCFAEARVVLPQCFPSTASRVYLDGCFIRNDNYDFSQEYLGPNDTVVCGHSTQKDTQFKDAVRTAVVQAVENAVNSNGYAKEQLMATGLKDETAYVLANCWRSLNTSSCQACLRNASSKILGCLPQSEGRAIYTGCFIRYSNTNFLNKKLTTGNPKGTITVIIVSVISFLILLTLGVTTGAYFWKVRTIQNKRTASNDAEKLVHILLDSSLNFKYSTLEKATGSFATDNKLGQGGFGTVYKGVLPDGREVAIKRLLFNNKHRAADFYREVNIVSSLQHKNLVRLLGCSCSGPESLLVYELVPNKSLDHFIFVDWVDPVLGRTLDWRRRYDIVVGTAEGLVYLHETASSKIIHRDIKASNILLDSRFRAKIADFGLARTFQEDKSHISTAIAGTMGYMAPEYLAHGQLTEKADVFGVLLLEMVTGRRNSQIVIQESPDSLVTTTWKHFQRKTVEELFDPNLLLPNDYSNIKQEISKVVHIGLLCTQEAPSIRPSMSRTLQMLVNEEADLAAPTSPPFTDERTLEFNALLESPSYPLKGGSLSSTATLASSSICGR